MVPQCLAKKKVKSRLFIVTWLNTNVNMKVKYSYQGTAKCLNLTPNIDPV